MCLASVLKLLGTTHSIKHLFFASFLIYENVFLLLVTTIIYCYIFTPTDAIESTRGPDCRKLRVHEVVLSPAPAPECLQLQFRGIQSRSSINVFSNKRVENTKVIIKPYHSNRSVTLINKLKNHLSTIYLINGTQSLSRNSPTCRQL